MLQCVMGHVTRCKGNRDVDYVAVLQSIGVCCSVLQCLAVCDGTRDLLERENEMLTTLQCVAIYCSVLQCVAVCRSA